MTKQRQDGIAPIPHVADADLADGADALEAVEEAHEERIDNARRARSAWPVRMKDVDGELKVA